MVGNQLIETQKTGLSESERVEACCAIARERLEVGDYDGGVAVLKSRWHLGQWPIQAGLNSKAAAELLLIAGTLSGLLASTNQFAGGQRPAEALLSGSVALFEQEGREDRASEARIELGWCYFWQGLFDLARTCLRSSFETLGIQQKQLRSVALIRMAVVEHYAGRLADAVGLLDQ